MRMKLIPEILNEVSQASTDFEKISILQKNSSDALKKLLIMAYNPETLYRQDLPQYKPDPAPEGLAINSLYMETKRMYIFAKSSPVTVERKNQILQQMLETFHPSECTLLENIFRGTFQKKYNISPDVIRMVFPGVISNVPSVPEPKPAEPKQKKPASKPKQSPAVVSTVSPGEAVDPTGNG